MLLLTNENYPAPPEIGFAAGTTRSSFARCERRHRRGGRAIAGDSLEAPESGASKSGGFRGARGRSDRGRDRRRRPTLRLFHLQEQRGRIASCQPHTRGGAILGTPLVLDRSDGSLERTQATIERTAELQDASARRLASCGRPIQSNAMLLRAVSARRRAERVARVHNLRVLRRQAFALADAERRRIADDLHDGAQQRFSVVGIQLAQLVELLEDDPAGAERLARRLVVDVDEAISELRRLVRGVYPAVLTDHGLVPALRTAARDLPTPTTVRARRIGRYPKMVETAVYFSCMEALQNAIKHAPDATEITLTLATRAGRLEFDVCDNGPGVPADAHPGHGFTSMQARIASVAGQLRVITAAGAGTRVVGSVPLNGSGAASHLPARRT